MSETKELTAVAIGQPSMSVAELRTLATDFARSGYFSDAREGAQAVVKIQAGVELGFGPVYSMTKIHIVEGKIAVSAEAMGAMVKRSGRYDYQVVKLTDTECELKFTDNGTPVYNSRFTIEDAKRANLVKPNGGWVKWPRAMLMSKALSQGARIVCPHVIAGTYTPEDFGVEINDEGQVIDGEGRVIEPPACEAPAPDPGNTPPEPEPLEALATEAQRRKIFATTKEYGYTEDDLRDYIKRQYSKEHTKDLTRKEAGDVILAIQESRIRPQGELFEEES